MTKCSNRLDEVCEERRDGGNQDGRVLSSRLGRRRLDHIGNGVLESCVGRRRTVGHWLLCRQLQVSGGLAFRIERLQKTIPDQVGAAMTAAGVSSKRPAAWKEKYSSSWRMPSVG